MTSKTNAVRNLILAASALVAGAAFASNAAAADRRVAIVNNTNHTLTRLLEASRRVRVWLVLLTMATRRSAAAALLAKAAPATRAEAARIRLRTALVLEVMVKAPVFAFAMAHPSLDEDKLRPTT